MIDESGLYRTPLEVNPDMTPPSMKGAPEADWSGLMTDILKSLTRAEEHLRLIHMDPKHISKARGHMVIARHTLMLLERWEKEKP